MCPHLDNYDMKIIQENNYLKLILLLLLITIQLAASCGPGFRTGRRPPGTKLVPLLEHQHIPSVSELTIGASGPSEGHISRGSVRFNQLVRNYNPNIVFADRDGTGNDRIMTKVRTNMLSSCCVCILFEKLVRVCSYQVLKA